MRETDGGNIFLSTLPAGPRDRAIALGVLVVTGVLFAVTAPFASMRLAAVPGFVRELSVGARDQRHHHRAFAVLAILDPALASAAGAGDRLSVHGDCGLRARADLSGPLYRKRTVGRGDADHGLALHGLAWRISAAGARLCTDEGQGGRIEGSVGRAIIGSAVAVAVVMAAVVWVLTERHDIMPVLLTSEAHYTTSADRRGHLNMPALRRGHRWCCGSAGRIPSSISG